MTEKEAIKELCMAMEEMVSLFVYSDAYDPRMYQRQQWIRETLTKIHRQYLSNRE